MAFTWRHLFVFLIIMKCTFLVLSLKLQGYFKADYQEDITLDIVDDGGYKRDLYLLQLFPESIQIRFKSTKANVDLNLKKNAALHKNTPIYTAYFGSVIQEYIANTENIVQYQDIKYGAAFMVEFNETHICDMVGSIHIKREEFWLERPSSAGQNKFSLLKFDNKRNRYADHVVRGNSMTSLLQNILRNINRQRHRQNILRTSNRQRHRQNILRTTNRQRQKRAVVQYTVELLVVADYSVYKFWYDRSTSADKDADAKKSIRQFYAFTINAMDMRYRSIKSSSYSLSVVFAGIVIASNPASSTWTENIKDTSESDTTVNVDTALQLFGNWVESTSRLPDHDHAMLFTKYNLISDSEGIDNVGLAFNSMICKPESQSVVEDYFSGAFMTTATHELGHSLGADHDGDNNECDGSDGYVMAATSSVKEGSKAQNPWKFSKCSIDAFETVIEDLNSDDSNCMTSLSPSHNPTALKPYDQQKPGQIYTIDQQCQYAVKFDQSSLCRASYNNEYSSVCVNMLCSKPASDSCEVLYALEGTTCGNKKWCSGGHCVSSDDAPAAVDNCLFGDTPGTFLNQYTCADILEINVYNCEKGWYKYCCSSCLAAQTGIPDCAYGDKESGCDELKCEVYSEDELKKCCKTCYKR